MADTTILTLEYGKPRARPTFSDECYAIRNSETAVIRRASPRNVLYAFDGTNNNLARAKEFRTNIAILHQLYQGRSHYMAGVGSSQSQADKLVDYVAGGFSGFGATEKLNAMFEAFKDDYISSNGKIEIDIIGFSRGAAMARHFAHMISRYEPPSNPNMAIFNRMKDDLKKQQCGLPQQLSPLLSGKLSSSTGLWRGPSIGAARGNLGGNPGIPTSSELCEVSSGPPEIRFLGIFDTVGSFYMPGNEDEGEFVLWIPDNVKHVRHAIAKHEYRKYFPLTQINDVADGLEVGFDGAHSDIGGGYKDNLAALEPFTWMRDEARNFGVIFREATITTEEGGKGDFRAARGLVYHESFKNLGVEHTTVNSPVTTHTTRYSHRYGVGGKVVKLKREVYEPQKPSYEQ